jgi:predicted RNA-binding Zn-ribbon protein involved in translation (DUF1610 family)
MATYIVFLVLLALVLSFFSGVVLAYFFSPLRVKPVEKIPEKKYLSFECENCGAVIPYYRAAAGVAVACPSCNYVNYLPAAVEQKTSPARSYIEMMRGL